MVDLEELQALPFPRAELSGESEKLNEYFRRFLPPRVDASGAVRCVGCGSRLTGLFGVFEWGIQHGSGFCHECRYPVRMFHFHEDEAGVEQRFEYPLQPHPDDLKQQKEAS